MLYRHLKPLLFQLDPETAHGLTLTVLDRLARWRLLPHATPSGHDEAVKVMGIRFPNRLGLAAGLDKNGAHLAALARLGFGFIEIGTVTPRPQPGNPRPRLFRLTEAQAIINRMGFNNEGVDALVANVERSQYRGVLGINIGKNFDTPIERAAEDYALALRKVYACASYVTINVSSPNTKNLRDLQHGAELQALLAALTAERKLLETMYHKRVPLAVKIAPDLHPEQLDAVADVSLAQQIDAVIATNTTLAREAVAGMAHADEAGGLSGAPLRERATEVVRTLARKLGGRIPIIAVGGILSGADALDKLRAGAQLVQIYTGLVYRGPELVQEIRRALRSRAATATSLNDERVLSSPPT